MVCVSTTTLTRLTRSIGACSKSRGCAKPPALTPTPLSGKYWMDSPPLAARNLITLNVPDATAEDLEEMIKKAADMPKGGWYRVPFSPELLAEITGSQGKAMGSGPSGSA